MYCIFIVVSKYVSRLGYGYQKHEGNNVWMGVTGGIWVYFGRNGRRLFKRLLALGRGKGGGISDFYLTPSPAATLCLFQVLNCVYSSVVTKCNQHDQIFPNLEGVSLSCCISSLISVV